jgi:hypothetical protein
MRSERLQSRDRAAARRAKLLEHPARSIAMTAVVWGGTMWLIVVRAADLFSLVTLTICSAGFGFAWLWMARRAQRKLTIKASGRR